MSVPRKSLVMVHDGLYRTGKERNKCKESN
jgi:hypothetical protein